MIRYEEIVRHKSIKLIPSCLSFTQIFTTRIYAVVKNYHPYHLPIFIEPSNSGNKNLPRFSAGWDKGGKKWMFPWRTMRHEFAKTQFVEPQKALPSHLRRRLRTRAHKPVEGRPRSGIRRFSNQRRQQKLRFRGRKYGPADVLILGRCGERERGREIEGEAAARLCSGNRWFVHADWESGELELWARARARARGRQVDSGWEVLCGSETDSHTAAHTRSPCGSCHSESPFPRVQSSPRHSTGRYLFLSKPTHALRRPRAHTYTHTYIYTYTYTHIPPSLHIDTLYLLAQPLTLSRNEVSHTRVTDTCAKYAHTRRHITHTNHIHILWRHIYRHRRTHVAHQRQPCNRRHVHRRITIRAS